MTSLAKQTPFAIIHMKKLIKIVLSFGVVASIIYVVYAMNVLSSMKKDSFPRTILETNNPLESISKNQTVPQPEVTSTVSKGITTTATSPLDGIDQADARDNIQWHADKGHFTEDDLRAYESYTDDALTALSNNNDIRATQVLGDRFFDRGDKDAAVNLYYLAAAQGSSAILLTLSHLAEPPHQVGETPEERKIIYRDSVIESLAILKTMAVRGDIRTSALGIETQKKSYETLAKEPLILSQDDLKKIDMRAQEIYNDLQKKRYELGLGEFDNSTSKMERLLYEFFY